MRSLKVFILLYSFVLMLAFGSCRTQQQSSAEYTDSVTVVASGEKRAVTSEDLLTFFRSTCSTELADITILFYPPDSAHPDARAAPKSITIGRASSDRNALQATESVANTDMRETVNLSARSNSHQTQESKATKDTLRCTDWGIGVAAIGIIVFAALLIYRKLKRLPL